MLCEHCKKNPASVHTVSVINGVKQEHYLCADCARNLSMNIPSLMEILSGQQAAAYTQQLPACACGMTFPEFQKTGLLGCPKCYDTFWDQLMPVIKRAQGGRLQHVGRGAGEGAKREEAQTKPQEAERSEAERLREELQAAVQAEHYERAAELRDRLKALEEREGKR